MKGITFSKDSKKVTDYFAFFDLDRTIISENSGKVLIKHAYKNGLITKLDIIRSVYISLLYKLDLKDTTKIIATLVSWLKGVPEKTMADLSEEICEDYLFKSIRPEIRSEIEFHKINGAGVIILSSAILPVCQRIASHLALDDVICSKLEIINGSYTGRSSGSICFGEEKLVRLREYCAFNRISISDTWYYTDSISDLSVLESVGNPVCVNPDNNLRKTAYRRGWKILL